MKPFATLVLSAALLGGSAFPASAQSLLGIIGGKDDSALITLGSGEAGSSGLVNLGLGGGSGNVLDANVGGSNTAAANVSAGSGGVSANVNVLNDTVTTDVQIGGGSLANVDVGIGGGTVVDIGIGGGGGGGGGGGDGGGNGGGNGSGNGGGGNGGGGNGGGVIVPGGFASAGSTSGSSAASCQGLSNAQLERLLRDTRIDGSWNRASGVNLQRVPLCPEQIAWLRNNGVFGGQLSQAVASDELLSASLRRASTDPSRVVAVQRKGSQLTVYVY